MMVRLENPGDASLVVRPASFTVETSAGRLANLVQPGSRATTRRGSGSLIPNEGLLLRAGETRTGMLYFRLPETAPDTPTRGLRLPEVARDTLPRGLRLWESSARGDALILVPR